MSKLSIKIEGYSVTVKVSDTGDYYLAEMDTFFPVGCVALGRKEAVENAKKLFLHLRDTAFTRLLKECQL